MGWTALHHCAINNHQQIGEMLLVAGADPNKRSLVSSQFISSVVTQGDTGGEGQDSSTGKKLEPVFQGLQVQPHCQPGVFLV